VAAMAAIRDDKMAFQSQEMYMEAIVPIGKRRDKKLRSHPYGSIGHSITGRCSPASLNSKE